MYVCVYIYIHLYVYVYVYAYVYACIHTCIHVYMYTYIHTNKHTYIHTYIQTYIRTYVHTYIHTYILLRVHMSRNLFVARPMVAGDLFFGLGQDSNDNSKLIIVVIIYAAKHITCVCRLCYSVCIYV